jgi:hypothetical protein
MINCVRVQIRKNEAFTVECAVPPWEVPILNAVHGPDNVKEVGHKLIDRALPEPQDEFDRLNNRYKRSRDENGAISTPYVHMVYGQLGVQKLADAIKAAFVEPPQGDLVGQVSSVGG